MKIPEYNPVLTTRIKGDKIIFTLEAKWYECNGRIVIPSIKGAGLCQPAVKAVDGRK